MSKIFIFITLFLLTLSIDLKSLINLMSIPPESDFIPIDSREVTEIEFNKTNSELYYSFKNLYNNSDIIINLKAAKGFTTNCYIYDSYDKIQTDEKGDYINPLTQFTLTENSIILKSSEFQINITTYYIILKDMINSYYKDYFSIFNELDTIHLQNEEILTIDKFYSKNIVRVHFTHRKDEKVTLDLNINNAEFMQYIRIYSAVTKEEVYVGEKNRGEIVLNEGLDEEGEYFMDIASREYVYTEIKSSIVLHKEERSVTELKYGNPKTFAFTTNKVFNFYADIDEYDFNDESIVTFKFGKQVFDRNLLSHCYAKVINFETNDDNKFLPNMPAREEDNEAVFARLTGTSDVYQLYFKKTKDKEEGKKSFLLIHLSFHIGEHDPNEYISPEEFTVYLSDKPETIELEEYKYNNNILDDNIIIESYTPKIYKVILSKNIENSDKPSYVFYTSDNIQVVYNNTMLDYNSHLYENSRMIYALSRDADYYDYTNILYIKLYGFSENETNFRVESNPGVINYVHNEYRKSKTLSDKIINCRKSYYYIGDYGYLVEKGFMYPEILYGKIKIYYKGKVDPGDKSILINEDEKYLVKGDYIPLDTSLDIVEFQCESPSFYQAHLLDEVDSRDINLYSRKYNYLPAGKNFTITPILNPIQEDINFEIYTPTGKEIKISDGENETTIDSKNKYYQIKYKNVEEVPSYFTVLSNEDTIISITLTNQDPFVIVDGEYCHVDDQSQIIIKLPQSQDYVNANIIITRIFYGFSYSLFRGNTDYASKLIESEYDYITTGIDHLLNVTVDNPYLRNKNADIIDDNDIYYVLFSIDDPEMIQKNVYVTYNQKKQYEKMTDGIPKAILSESEKYSLPTYEDNSTISIVYQSCGNSLDKILIKSDEEEYETIDSGSQEPIYQLGKIQFDSDIDLQVSIKFKDNLTDNLTMLYGAIVGFSDKNITDKDIDYYNSLQLNISQNENKVEWNPLDGVEQYDIFVLDENNSYIQYLNNSCFLQVLKNNLTYIDDSYIKYYKSNTNSITLDEKGNYSVAVSANITKKIPLVYIYEIINYDSSLVPPPKGGGDDDDGINGTLIFVLIALPLVLIIVCLLLFFLIRAQKDAEPIDNPNNEIKEMKNDIKEEEEEHFLKEKDDDN